jgi:hypothetical protein
VVGFLTLFLCTGTKQVPSTNGLGVIRTQSLIGETSVVFRVKPGLVPKVAKLRGFLNA